MDVFYIAYYEEDELNIEAFNNKDELNKCVTELKSNDTRYNLVKLKNNSSIKGFIDFISENKLSESFHKMMQRNK